ncbi:MAG: EAL domain-containing protein [Actinobacteria bacterium]|nr:MAG: EAL domain-containing protein [Actinomycetota bacterium]
MRPDTSNTDPGPAESGREAHARAPATGPCAGANGASGHVDVASAAGRPSLAEVQGDSEQIVRLFEMTGDLLATVSREGRFMLLNPAWEEALGWRREELLQRSLQDLLHPDDVEQTLALLLAGGGGVAQLENFTSRVRHRDGSWRTLLWSARSGGSRWYAAAKDVTDRESDRDSLERKALHDPLTRLPNRLLLMDRTHQALARLHRSGGLVALLFMDFDRFKSVNDRFGHDVGDRLLLLVSGRLEEMMRDSDTVARLGGDEFVVLAEDLESEAEALALAERVLETLRRPFVVGRTEVSMPASVGVALSRDPEADPEAMLREADVAMYRAKGSGGARMEVFGESLRLEVKAHLEIERRLAHALPREELRLDYQPIVPLAGGRALAAEALVRWQMRGQDGASRELLPATFLPRASESGLITKIGDWVLHSVCEQADRWRRSGVSVPIAINVSERELTELDLAHHISAALAAHRLPGRSLCLEVSEEAVMHDLERAGEALKDVKSLGVTIALDNFGAGHSSLGLPKDLPLDMIKLDRTLVANFERDRKVRAMVAAMVALAHEAGLRAVVVGIETVRQLALARELNGSVGQGYLLHRPEPPVRLDLTGTPAAITSAPWRPHVRLGESNRR